MGEAKRRLVVGSLVPLIALASGCVRYERADAVEPGRFTALWQRDLSRFEHRIAMEKHTGSDDDWTVVAEAWLDFVNCDEIDREVELTDPLAAYVHATLVAEDVRRALAIYRADGRSLDPAIYVDAAAPDFFERSASDVPSELIQWPTEEEGWVDEVPARRAIASNCGGLRNRVLATRLRPDDEESPVRTFRDWMDTYLTASAVAVDRYEALETSGAPAQLAWSNQMWVAALTHEVAQRWAEFADTAQKKAEKGISAEENRARAENGRKQYAELASYAEGVLREIVPNTPAGVDPAEAARAKLLLAWYELENERPARALELLAAARTDGLDDENFWAARYLELRVASDAAQWKVAAELANGLPPRTSRVHGAYFYRIAVAAKRLNQPDRFLNVAMKAFRDRPYKADPFLRALYWEMLQTLADYPFDDRVIEMLEDMGHRGDTSERVEEYARVALDRGQAANADAAARWLLTHEHDKRFHPRYHGIIALAAFVDDDTMRFEAAAADVVARPSSVESALPERRRATFFRDADQELARLLRQMLPVMAEWGDDRAARDRRQRWLRVIVGQSQQFVRETETTLARPQLLELYRLASKLLDDHPRGYAERVGEEEPAPIVLGTVRVERRDLDKHEPTVELQMQAPYSLTLIPRDDLAPVEWPRRWPAEAGP